MPPWTKVNERCVLFHQSVILFFFNIIQNRIIWQAVVPFLLLTLLLLGYNQEIMWTTEHLPLQRPNNSQLMTSYGQRSLRGRVGMYLHKYWHLTTCGYPSKTLVAKKLTSFFCKRTFFEEINKAWKLYELPWNLVRRLPRYQIIKKLCERIPFSKSVNFDKQTREENCKATNKDIKKILSRYWTPTP